MLSADTLADYHPKSVVANNMRIRHPPGRSGRPWLIDRLAVAERVASILHRKHQALRQEEIRLAALTERSAALWTDVVRQAEASQRQAMILGARSDLRAAATLVGPANARLVWRTEMGVEIPAEASCDLPPTPPIPGTPALAAGSGGLRSCARSGSRTCRCHRCVGARQRGARRHPTAVAGRARPLDPSAPSRALQVLELRLDDHEREELSRGRLHHLSAAVSAPSTQEQQ